MSKDIVSILQLISLKEYSEEIVRSFEPSTQTKHENYSVNSKHKLKKNLKQPNIESIYAFYPQAI